MFEDEKILRLEIMRGLKIRSVDLAAAYAMAIDAHAEAKTPQEKAGLAKLLAQLDADSSDLVARVASYSPQSNRLLRVVK